MKQYLKQTPWLIGAVLAAMLSTTALAAEWRDEGPALGVVSDLVSDPHQPDRVYATTINGGYFRSDDFGDSWQRLSDQEFGGGFDWLQPDPVNPSVLWAIFGGTGSKVLRHSTDGGATWKRIDSLITDISMRIQPTGGRMVFAPSDPKIIYVPSTNLHYRSTDGGKTWSGFRVQYNDSFTMAVDPANPRRLYAAGRGERYQISVSDDGGDNWTPIGAGLPENRISQILIHGQRPTTLYAVVARNEVWISEDSGQSFAPLPSKVGLKFNEEMRLYLDPRDSDRLWLVGQGGILRGDPQGNWVAHERGTGGWLSRSFVIHPRDGRLLVGMAGDGIYRSLDDGANWTLARNGLYAGWIERIFAAPGQQSIWVEASVGLFRRDGDGPWQEPGEPLVRNGNVSISGLLFDRHAPGQILIHSSAGFWRSSDGGRSWKTPMAPIKEPSMRQMMKGIMQLPTPEFSSFAQDPQNPRVMYGGGRGRTPGEAVFRSSDGGVKWEPAGQGIASETVDWLLSPKSGVLLGSTRDKALYRSADGAGSWQSVGNGWPVAKIAGWVVDPTSEDRIYVATDKGLYRSDDAGQSWTRHANGVKDVEVAAVAVSPGGTLLIGSTEGLYISRDHGEQFELFDADDQAGNVTALAFGGEPLRLYVGTGVSSLRSLPWTE